LRGKTLLLLGDYFQSIYILTAGFGTHHLGIRRPA